LAGRCLGRGTFVIDGIVIAIHVILSLALVALILLHAGRGGGLSDAFGGGMGPLGGLTGSTVVERNLDRITVGVGVLFALTTLVLVVLLS
jgi:preprotein translocase subunit SecG